jgi:hypothetical protein
VQRVVATPDRRPCVVRRVLVQPTRWKPLEMEFEVGPPHPHGELHITVHASPIPTTGYAAPTLFVDWAASATWFVARLVATVLTAPVVVPLRVVLRRPWLVEAICAEPGGRRSIRLTWWVVGVRRSRRFAADVAAALEHGELPALIAGAAPTRAL